MKTPGSKLYRIEYVITVVKEDIPDLTQAVRIQIRSAIEEKLTIDPLRFGKPLRYSLKSHRSLRVGDYRVLYRVDGANHLITVVAIRHRKDVYDKI